MPLLKDNEAERHARIDQLLGEVRLKKASLRPVDHQLRRDLAFQLDSLLGELVGPFQAPKHAAKPRH